MGKEVLENRCQSGIEESTVNSHWKASSKGSQGLIVREMTHIHTKPHHPYLYLLQMVWPFTGCFESRCRVASRPDRMSPNLFNEQSSRQFCGDLKGMMEHSSLRTILALFGIAMLTSCQQPSDEPSQARSEAKEQLTEPIESTETTNYLVQAKKMLRNREFATAAQAASRAMIQNPNDIDAVLVASQIEAARGNAKTAIELAGSIDTQSPQGAKAIEIQAEQLARLGRHNEAAEVIVTALQTLSSTQLRHRAWLFLNRCGRCEEASRQVDVLCQQGTITMEELMSLVRRTEAFPHNIRSIESAKKYFSPGLGLARWYFSEKKYRQALDELASQYDPGFESPAACALYGRLLAETQAFERFPVWHAKCPSNTNEFGDYWAALGIYFYGQHQHSAAAGAFLEAVSLNPTDQASTHRLGMVFDALNRPDDAEQFRDRGIGLSQCSTAVTGLHEHPEPLKQMQGLAREILELGRPFEALQWTSAILSTTNPLGRMQIDQKRIGLLNNEDAVHIASQTALVGLSRIDFEIDSAIDRLRENSVSSLPRKAAVSRPMSQPVLKNVAQEVRLDFQYYKDVEIDLDSIPIHEFMGGGIAVLDYDLDGWPDVYFAQGGGDPPSGQCTRSNTLFRNVEGVFQVATDSQTQDFNFSTGLAAGDVNQDGFIDLLLGSVGRNRLFINNGDGTFRDSTVSLGKIADQFTASVAIADIDGDRLPDLFEANYIEMENAFILPSVEGNGKPVTPAPLDHYAAPDRWFHNQSDGSFVPHHVDLEVAKPGTSLGIVVSDFDGDGANEVFVGNDARPNHLLVFQDKQGLQNLADVRGLANGFQGSAYACMGIASGDFDRDGRLDLYITNFFEESANFYLQTSPDGFADVAVRYDLESVSLPFVGFGTKAIDLDRNGWLDLLVTNGHVFDLKDAKEPFRMPPQILLRSGSRFELVKHEEGDGYWGKESLGRTMATFDFDCDGDLDVLITHLDRPVAVLRNETSTPGHWIQLELVGTKCERDAVGARVVVTAGEEQFTRWVTAGDGYLCSDEPVLDFGIAHFEQADKVEVYWPNGNRQTFQHLEAGKRYLITEGESGVFQRWIFSKMASGS